MEKVGKLSSFHVFFLSYGPYIAKNWYYIYALSENRMFYMCWAKINEIWKTKHQKCADAAEI